MNNIVLEASRSKPSETADGTDRNSEIESSRSKALLAISIETVQSLDQTQILAAQTALQHGNVFATWVTPSNWLPPGTALVRRSTDLRQRITDHLAPELWRSVNPSRVVEAINQAVLALTRYLVLLRMGPAGLGRKGRYRSLDPSTITSAAYSYGPAIFALAITKKITSATQSNFTVDNPKYFLARLVLDDFSTLSRSKRQLALHECKRMRMLAELGLWQDVPSLTVRTRTEAMKGAERQNEAQPQRDSHLPLPDGYVAEMGKRSLWLMHDLAPNLFVLGREIRTILETSNETSLASVTWPKKFDSEIRALLAAHKWKDAKNSPFKKPPFSIQLTKPRGPGATKIHSAAEPRWPPVSIYDFYWLLGVVQSAHYFIVALSMGARQSETLSLSRDCVVYASDGRPYANGKTYKLVEKHDGEWRDWLLPVAAVDALEQQIRLVKIAEHLTYPQALGERKDVAGVQHKTPMHIWGRLSGGPGRDPTLPLNNVNRTLTTYAENLCMETAPEGQSLRSHRFRKTLARLVALALTQAPKLLMDLFGHKSIEATLYYILADKSLRAEIETVSRELRVMRAKEAVDRMVAADSSPMQEDEQSMGGYGGLAAVSLYKSIQVHRERVHRKGEQWGANNAIELAELLTLQGKAWEQVRPGVLCTKFPGEAGPCNKSKGRPEPSKCQSTCVNRLEEAFLREDVDSSIRDCVAAYELAVAEEESLTAAHWAAQIRENVPRFADLRAKWVVNPTVQALIGVEGSASI